MAWIDGVPADSIPEAERSPDPDNILGIHGVHPAIIRRHYELFRALICRVPGLRPHDEAAPRRLLRILLVRFNPLPAPFGAGYWIPGTWKWTGDLRLVTGKL